jgi:hypothetical protein
MSQINLLEKRRLKLEQRKNRLAQDEALVKIQLRKQRTRRLIELGGLIAKAKLENWDSNTLFGALLSLKEAENNVSAISQWTLTGRKTFSKED